MPNARLRPCPWSTDGKDRGHLRLVGQPSTQPSFMDEQEAVIGKADNSWLLHALAPFATRRAIAAQTELFANGEPARSYYLVLSGKLIVHRKLVYTTATGSRSVVRLVTPGDLFIFDTDGVHVANCDAIADSLLLRVDRRSFELQATLDPLLMGVRNAVHAGELEFILQGLGGQSGSSRHQAPKRALAGSNCPSSP